MRSLGLVLGLLMLVGCNDQVSITVYTRDLVEVAEDVTVRRVATADYSTQILASVEKCEETAGSLQGIIGSYITLSADRPIWCDKSGTDTLLHVRFDIPIFNPGADNTDVSGALAIVVPTLEGPISSAHLWNDGDALYQMADAINGKLMGAGFNPRATVLRFSVQNDLRDPVAVISAGSFVNGAAVMPDRDDYKVTTELAARGQVELQLSALRSQLLLDNPGRVTGFWWSATPADLPVSE